ncbi:MAG: hypothetical protein JWL73_468 [Actinomycetia bacterium]|nr:hypothetical protein [Actinomycetes bacterium]
MTAGLHLGFPLPDRDEPLTAPFWDAAQRHEFAMQWCGSCSRFVWYPRESCSGCGGALPEWRVLSGRGALFTWTEVARALIPEYGGTVPYTTAIVTLAEDDRIRFVTRLVARDDDPRPPILRGGMAVEVTFRPLSFPPATDAVTAPFVQPVELG